MHITYNRPQPAKLICTILICVCLYLLAACSLPSENQTTAGVSTGPRADGKTEVIILGMIHGAHKDSQRYSLDRLRNIIRDIDPDIILTEIPAGRAEEALASYRKTGSVTETRTRAFPEYTDVIIPLHDEIGFWLVGTAGWTEDIAKERTAALQSIEQDPKRATQWAEHKKAHQEFTNAVKNRSDDPLFIHSAAYDKLVEASFQPYLQYFEDDLGAGGWAAINTAHSRNILNIIDTVEGRGKRVLITYGAAHKYWIARKLEQRDDVILLDPVPYFTANID